jgi:antitoxin (DNA-binding transcriptional repressor) of toxin-antitoxin stability system
MARYSVAQAQSDLTSLIEAVERGESVEIERPDPDSVIKLIWAPIRPRSAWDVEWLRANRVRPRRGRINTARAIEEMKDESPR